MVLKGEKETMNSITIESQSKAYELPYDETEEILSRIEAESVVTLENVGAIERLEFPVSPDGGVVVFKGRNGSGKSTGIEAVSCLLRGATAGMPTVRDGCRNGKVEGFGASINLSVSSRRKSGTPELVVDNIEGKFSISELVNPKSKTPEAADKERLKALVTLTGKQVDPHAFAELFQDDDEFRAIVSTSSLETTDPVEMARRVKSDVDREARKHEEMARQQQAKYEAMKGTYGEFHEEDVIPNLEQFQRAQRTVVCRLSELEERDKQNRDKERQIEIAKASISEINILEEEQKIETASKDIENAENDRCACEKSLASIDQSIADLEKDYQIRRIELVNQKHRVQDRIASAQERINSSRLLKTEVEENLLRLDCYRKTIEELSHIEPVDPEEIQKYRTLAKSQTERADRNAIARQLQSKIKYANEVAKEAERLRQKATRLREAGRNCDKILSELIGQESPLQIVDGRMVLQTSRGETFFSELSDGERWRVAFQTIAPFVRKTGELGLLTIPQVGWESLDPENQNLIQEMAREYKICVVTAEATADDLHVEAYR